MFLRKNRLKWKLKKLKVFKNFCIIRLLQFLVEINIVQSLLCYKYLNHYKKNVLCKIWLIPKFRALYNVEIFEAFSVGKVDCNEKV